MRRTLVFFVLAATFCAVFLISAGSAMAWNSYVHQRLAWMALPELGKTAVSQYYIAYTFGATEPDDHKGILKLRDHWKSKQRAIGAFNASLGAFQRGCMQESARRLGHSFHYVEDLGCVRKHMSKGMKDIVEKIGYDRMKQTVSSKNSTNALRDLAREYMADELANANKVEAVLAKLEYARGEFVKMIRYAREKAQSPAERDEKYKFIVEANLAVTLGTMMKLAMMYNQQTRRMWNAKQVSPNCHCPERYRLNQERNDCFYGNRNPVIALPKW
jgi:hypothetical protein